MGRKISAGARFLAEGIIALLVWLLFVFGWFRVLRMFPSSELAGSLQFVTSIIVLYGSAILIWVWLRVRRARRERGEKEHSVHGGRASMAGAGN